MNSEEYYQAFCSIYGNDKLEDYETKQIKIKKCDWEKPPSGITLFDIAIYIILNNPEPKDYLSKKRLDRIRNKVSEIKCKVISNKKKDFYIDWFSETIENDVSKRTFYVAYIESRMGKFSKYFIRNNIDDIIDTKKKYIQPSGVYDLSTLKHTQKI